MRGGFKGQSGARRRLGKYGGNDRTAQLVDGGSEKADLMASVAKAKVAKVAGLAVREGVQMHGGIGMTDEYDIGLYMKRDRALQEFLGDQYYHAGRVAELSGY